MYLKIQFKIKSLIINIKIVFNIFILIIRWDLSFPKKGWSIDIFERKCKSFFWIDYVLWVNNWTSALHSAFYAISNKLEVNNCLKWKEIICPSYTWWASILPATNLWAKICFADINKSDLTISIDSFKKSINKNTVAVLVPHLWWEVANLKEIIKIAKKNNIYVIEDASHCFWTSVSWKMVWTFWDIGIFSLQANKPVSWWEWWIFITNNKKLYEKAILFWHYERIQFISDKYKGYSKTWLWFKYRIHPISACMARLNLSSINYRGFLENEAMEYFNSKIKCTWIKLIRNNDKSILRWPQFWYKLIINFLWKNNKDKFLSLCKYYKIPIENEYLTQLDKEVVFSNVSYNVDWLVNTRSIYDYLFTLKPINVLDKKKIDIMIMNLNIIFKEL